MAVRALLGHDATASAPGDPRGPDRNLVWDHAEQPTAAEVAPSARPRLVATVGCAIAAPSVPPEMARVRTLQPEPEDDAWMLRLRLGGGETALVRVFIGAFYELEAKRRAEQAAQERRSEASRLAGKVTVDSYLMDTYGPRRPGWRPAQS